MKIALFGTKYCTEIDKMLRKTIDFLRNEGVDVYMERDFYAQIVQHSTNFPQCSVVGREAMAADVAISIGGDGTFLNTAAIIGDRNIPILGINAGRLGFLAEGTDDELGQMLHDVLAGNYRVLERSVLQARTSDKMGQGLPFALNEIAVLKQDLSSMIGIHTTIDGEYVHTYQADGLIVATPTGSTAYSMSVGGPIVAPTTNTLILSPVASHSLNVRPLVVADTCEIDLEIESRSKSFLISLDGRSQVMRNATHIHIAKANYTIKTIQPLDHTFFGTLKNKLLWGIDKRNR